MSLARVAVAVATDLEPQQRTLWDPCCGSGTLLFAARCAGARSLLGTELEPSVAAIAVRNLDATSAAAEAEAARIRAEAGEAEESTPARCEVVCGDALLGMPTLHGHLVSPDDVCVVTNLPFGRWVGVGGQTGNVPLKQSHAAALPALLKALRPRGQRFAFFSEGPLGEALDAAGYVRVRTAKVEDTGRRWLTLAERE